MKKLIINTHSFVDVITNSSTEIFVTTHDKSVEMIKSIIDTFLEAAGSDKKADDICKVYIKKDEDNEANWKDHPEASLVIDILPVGEGEKINLNEFLKSVFDITAEYNG